MSDVFGPFYLNFLKQGQISIMSMSFKARGRENVPIYCNLEFNLLKVLLI